MKHWSWALRRVMLETMITTVWKIKGKRPRMNTMEVITQTYKIKKYSVLFGRPNFSYVFFDAESESVIKKLFFIIFSFSSLSALLQNRVLGWCLTLPKGNTAFFWSFFGLVYHGRSRSIFFCCMRWFTFSTIGCHVFLFSVCFFFFIWF